MSLNYISGTLAILNNCNSLCTLLYTCFAYGFARSSIHIAPFKTTIGCSVQYSDGVSDTSAKIITLIDFRQKRPSTVLWFGLCTDEISISDVNIHKNFSRKYLYAPKNVLLYLDLDF